MPMGGVREDGPGPVEKENITTSNIVPNRQ